MPENSVDVAVRWAESGGDIPTRVQSGLRGIRGAADEAAPSIGEKMATAFGRLEQREPTMVLRRSALAMEELAASSLGATGPLGRLAATLPLLFGPTGFLAIGALAGVGLGIRGITEETTKWADSLEKVNKRIAEIQLGKGFGRAQDVAGLRAQFGQTGEPSFLETGMGFINELLTEGIMSGFTRTFGLTTVFGQAAEGMAAQRKIEGDRIMQALGLSTGEDITTRNENLLKEQIERNKDREAAEKQAAEGIRFLAGVARATGEHMREMDAVFQEANRKLKLANDPLAQLLAKGLSPTEAVARLNQILPIPTFAGNNVQTGAGGPVPGWMLDQTQDLVDQVLADSPFKPDGGDTDSAIVARVIAHSMSVVGDVARGAGPGTVLGAIGGTMAAIPSLQIPGAIAAGAGGLLSAFGVGAKKPSVIIAAFEEQAREQLKEARAEPLTTSFTFVGPGAQATFYDLGRLAARGVNPRFGT